MGSIYALIEADRLGFFVYFGTYTGSFSNEFLVLCRSIVSLTVRTVV